MNSEKMKKAIEKVFEELSDMSKEEFKREFEKHKSGDIAEIILETGALRGVDFGKFSPSG